MRKIIVLASLVWALAAPAAAGAAALSFGPPSQPPPEDVAFTVAVEGSADGSATGVRVIAKARVAAGIACGSAPWLDPGKRFLDDPIESPAFERFADFVPDRPGDHLLCAWLVDGQGDTLFGPVSAIVPVRGPFLSVRFDGPGGIRPGHRAIIDISYETEAPRRLSVYLTRGTVCEIPSDPIDVFPDPDIYQEIAYISVEAGVGELSGGVQPERWGQWILCGLFFDSSSGPAAPSGLAVSQLVRVGEPRRRCGAVGGRRGITQVATGGITCSRGRSIARRWGAARAAPRTISGLRCRRGTGRSVRCSGNPGEVTFRYRR